MSDQRLDPRYAIEVDAEVRISPEHLVSGRTENVSRGGFCMDAAEPIERNTVCEVRLSLVFSETHFSEHLLLPATIVWCTKLPAHYQIGFKFGSLTAEHKKYLSLFIEFLEGGEAEAEDEKDVEEES